MHSFTICVTLLFGCKIACMIQGIGINCRDCIEAHAIKTCEKGILDFYILTYIQFKKTHKNMEASIQYLGNLGLSKKRKPYIIITIDQKLISLVNQYL